MVFVDAELQGCPTFLSGFIDICSMRKQLLADVEVACVNGTMVGRPTSRSIVVYYLITVLLLTLFYYFNLIKLLLPISKSLNLHFVNLLPSSVVPSYPISNSHPESPHPLPCFLQNSR